MAGTLRKEVLILYKRILRVGKNWNAAHAGRTIDERKYITEEARALFRKNAQVSSNQAIQEHIQEGEARLELALHYRNPYPRPVNLPPNAYPAREGKKSLGRAHDRLIQQSRPVYVKSLDRESGLKDQP